MTEVATELMGVDAASSNVAYHSVLRQLVQHLNLDFSFLRHNDFDISATRLTAEWPVRTDIPQPDPLALVYFKHADSVFQMAETLKETMVFRPGDETEEYRRRVEDASGYVATSMAVVPLLDKERTTGTLGLIKIGDRAWSTEELNALKTVATLLTQLGARVAAEEQIRYLALHDDLTGLCNRRALLEHLEQRFAPTEPGPVAVLFLDLDRLKSINDFLGHLAGDEFVRQVSVRLRDRLDSHSMIARLSGDEFVIVLKGTHSAVEAETQAHHALALVSEQVTLGIERVSRSASIGIAVGVPGSVTPEEILRQADQAAFAAKSPGGNDISHFNEEMRAQTELRNDIEVHLRTAIANDALTLHYQPEVDLVTGKINAVEALVRWQHPSRGLLPPSSFIPVAEATNLAGELGRWVLHTACRTLAQWRVELPSLAIEMRVNVSPVQLVTDDFVATVADALRNNGIDGPSLCLEITEVAVVQDLERTRRTLAELRHLGVRVAIDDFGTGYSSLSHLKELPVDALKIDRGFVMNLGSGDTGDLAIINAITGLARSFDLDVIAEGVETRESVDILVGLGCTRAQGYLMSRPVPADDALALLRGVSIDF